MLQCYSSRSRGGFTQKLVSKRESLSDVITVSEGTYNIYNKMNIEYVLYKNIHIYIYTHVKWI